MLGMCCFFWCSKPWKNKPYPRNTQWFSNLVKSRDIPLLPGLTLVKYMLFPIFVGTNQLYYILYIYIIITYIDIIYIYNIIIIILRYYVIYIGYIRVPAFFWGNHPPTNGLQLCSVCIMELLRFGRAARGVGGAEASWQRGRAMEITMFNRWIIYKLGHVPYVSLLDGNCIWSQKHTNHRDWKNLESKS
jgi:hypothetical protein